jgi:glycosyl transferase family 25
MPTRSTPSFPLFVISLPDSTRFRVLERSLDGFRIPFKKIDAINAAKIDASRLADLYDEGRSIRRIGRPMSRGEIGSALSHRKVWDIIVKQNFTRALVLEDDAIIDETFCSFLRNIELIRDEVGFLSLFAKRGVVFRRPTANIGEFGVHATIKGLTGMVGYVITRNYARRLLALGSRVEAPVDWFENWSMGTPYLVFPMPVSHANDISILGVERQKLFDQYANSIRILPDWFPMRIRGLAYIAGVGYLLRPDRYDGFREYFRREIKTRLKYALFDTVSISQLSAERSGQAARTAL